MKIKTSITLSDKVLHEVDDNLTNYKNRSTFIEAALKYYLINKIKHVRNKNDLKILNDISGNLNRESEDVLSYQELF
ncbi:MAG: ribbon-helix-helix domain-containing protein [Spirochaetales bacterium]|nr:ribbon-helix-helix domain-containing protein [Spirochaetales bacterium]